MRRRIINNNILPDINLAMVDVNGNIQTTMETANCYVIKDIGIYQIPLVYGNGIKNDTINTISYTQQEPSSGNTQPFYNYKNQQITSPYIEEDTNTNVVSAEVLYSDADDYDLSDIQIVTGTPCRYIKFTVNSIPSLGGNLIIAIKDSNGVVMWSWHLWAYQYTIGYKQHTYNSVTYNWMDINLGWVKDGIDTKYGESPYYQWGRKDPMLRYNNSSNTPAIGSWSITSTATSLAQTIQNPNVFNTYNSSSNNNWWTDNGTTVNFYNYWNAYATTIGILNTFAKTIYDPCPRGWVMPNADAFGGCTASGGTWTSGYTWDNRYFTVNGCRARDTGNVINFYSHAYYTGCSNQALTSIYHFGFKSGTVSSTSTNSRSFGFNVCPVKE